MLVVIETIIVIHLHEKEAALAAEHADHRC